MIDRFYMNMQIEDFRKHGSIEFSNPEILPEYENELQKRKLAYMVVRGLGEYGVSIAICAPEHLHKYTDRLNYEIECAEKVLAIKKAAQHGVEPTVDRHSEPTYHPIRMDGKKS